MKAVGLTPRSIDTARTVASVFLVSLALVVLLIGHIPGAMT
ncbi:MAG: hypothetical protein AB1Z65_02305 [Candidatus Sulfomarinibacteraceae bacterium]